ncbi:hypothetical protein ACWGTO_33610, partial [Mesorhizobium sp. PL10]
ISRAKMAGHASVSMLIEASSFWKIHLTIHPALDLRPPRVERHPQYGCILSKQSILQIHRPIQVDRGQQERLTKNGDRLQRKRTWECNTTEDSYRTIARLRSLLPKVTD